MDKIDFPSRCSQQNIPTRSKMRRCSRLWFACRMLVTVSDAAPRDLLRPAATALPPLLMLAFEANPIPAGPAPPRPLLTLGALPRRLANIGCVLPAMLMAEARNPPDGAGSCS